MRLSPSFLLLIGPLLLILSFLENLISCPEYSPPKVDHLPGSENLLLMTLTHHLAPTPLLLGIRNKRSEVGKKISNAHKYEHV